MGVSGANRSFEASPSGTRVDNPGHRRHHDRPLHSEHRREPACQRDYLWCMRRPRFILTCSAWTLGLCALAQTNLDALVQTKRFHQPGQGDLVEVDISVIGASTKVVEGTGGTHARVEAITMVLRNDSLLDFRKSAVDGPAGSDGVVQDFLLQEHFVLKPGTYDIQVELRDLGAGDTVHTGYELPVVVDDRTHGPSISDIQFTTVGGNGTAIPFTGHYYPSEVGTLAFHAEVYGMPGRVGQDSLFLLTYQIEEFETRKVRGTYKRVQRAKAIEVVDVDGAFPIGDLPSGNYLVSVEARDRKGELLARQEQLMQRNNPLHYDPENISTLGSTFVDRFTDGDTLAEFLLSMVPVADDMERRLLEDYSSRKDLSSMQRIMYTFWYNRNGADPEGAWRRYKETVDQVNRLYGCRNLRGYESDQGRVYLKYGAPNTLVDRSNATATIPYQIWHYYHAGRYRDKRFVFWQPERSTTCWQLLHSEVPGEMKNPRWNEMLHQTDNPMSLFNSINGNISNSQSGQEVLDNFNNPR